METTTMNTYRTSEYTDRSPFRRKVDTQDRMDHLKKVVEQYGYQPRINRYAILLHGLDHLDLECYEATYQEVKAQLKDLFGCFDPMKALNNLTIRA